MKNKISKVLFMGSKKPGLKVLEQMNLLSPHTLIGALTIDDSGDTRTQLEEFRKFSSRNKVPLFIVKDKKQSEQFIADLKPDLCFVSGWYWLVSSKLIETIRGGFIGIHNSLLPKFRGASPMVWAIINGEKEVGFTFYSFTSGIDDGSIWAQGRVKVGEDDYIGHIFDNLENEIVHVMQEKYISILSGDIVPVEQDHSQATYGAQRLPKDGNIDWNKPSRDVYNFIRAQSDPYPGAFTYNEGRLLKIFKAKLFKDLFYGSPGQVARVADDGVYVICRDNRAIIIEELEVDQKRDKASKFINSVGIRLPNMDRS